MEKERARLKELLNNNTRDGYIYCYVELIDSLINQRMWEDQHVAYFNSGYITHDQIASYHLLKKEKQELEAAILQYDRNVKWKKRFGEETNLTNVTYRENVVNASDPKHNVTTFYFDGYQFSCYEFDVRAFRFETTKDDVYLFPTHMPENIYKITLELKKNYKSIYEELTQ